MLETEQVIGPKRGEENLGLPEGEQKDRAVSGLSHGHNGSASEVLESGLGKCSKGGPRRGRR